MRSLRFSGGLRSDRLVQIARCVNRDSSVLFVYQNKIYFDNKKYDEYGASGRFGVTGTGNMRMARWVAKWLLVPVYLAVGALTLSHQDTSETATKTMRLPGQGVKLQGEGADAFVKFRLHPKGIELHVLIHELGGDGELLRTRVVLDDGQRYEINVGVEGEEAAAEFSFIRVGDGIVATVLGARSDDTIDALGWVDGLR